MEVFSQQTVTQTYFMISYRKQYKTYLCSSLRNYTSTYTSFKEDKTYLADVQSSHIVFQFCVVLPYSYLCISTFKSYDLVNKQYSPQMTSTLLKDNFEAVYQQ